MDGHEVTNMARAAERGDLFITATGNAEVIREEHLATMPNGATLGNAGHFDVEIDIEALEGMADAVTAPTEGVTRYHMPDGRELNLLAAGRLVNLTGPYSKGHPAEVMDTTFAMMFLAGLDHVDGQGGPKLAPGLYAVPDRLDRRAARRKLETLDVVIDELTDRQEEYQASWIDETSY
jgi:adenosylhomocysteinase